MPRLDCPNSARRFFAYGSEAVDYSPGIKVIETYADRDGDWNHYKQFGIEFHNGTLASVECNDALGYLFGWDGFLGPGGTHTRFDIKLDARPRCSLFCAELERQFGIPMAAATPFLLEIIIDKNICKHPRNHRRTMLMKASSRCGTKWPSASEPDKLEKVFHNGLEKAIPRVEAKEVGSLNDVLIAKLSKTRSPK